MMYDNESWWYVGKQNQDFSTNNPEKKYFVKLKKALFIYFFVIPALISTYLKL